MCTHRLSPLPDKFFCGATSDAQNGVPSFQGNRKRACPFGAIAQGGDRTGLLIARQALAGVYLVEAPGAGTTPMLFSWRGRNFAGVKRPPSNLPFRLRHPRGAMHLCAPAPTEGRRTRFLASVWVSRSRRCGPLRTLMGSTMQMCYARGPRFANRSQAKGERKR